MLRGLDDFLSGSRWLIVVGYSFRDEHINAVIRRWYNQTANPHLTIVDPALEGLKRWDPERPVFLSELLTACLEPAGPNRETRLRKPHDVLALPASKALKHLFGSNPTT